MVLPSLHVFSIMKMYEIPFAEQSVDGSIYDFQFVCRRLVTIKITPKHNVIICLSRNLTTEAPNIIRSLCRFHTQTCTWFYSLQRLFLEAVIIKFWDNAFCLISESVLPPILTLLTGVVSARWHCLINCSMFAALNLYWLIYFGCVNKWRVMLALLSSTF